MAGGLIALLDDVAVLARLAAASLDDVAGATTRAAGKTAGVVIDDAAVAPGYVVGLPPQRELPIIAKIAIGSLRNKLIFILPVALMLSAFASWALTPVLMVGGVYLAFEGVEKIATSMRGDSDRGDVARIEDAAELEARQVGGAIRTDFILSAEIMMIALAELAGSTIVTQTVVLALVGIAVTVAVYGVVAVLVKADDIGLRLVEAGGPLGTLGRSIVTSMPLLLNALSLVGTAAMLWVGGGILVHGLASFGLPMPERVIDRAAAAIGGGSSSLEWAVGALGAGIVGIAAGTIVAAVLHVLPPGAGAKDAGH